MRTKAVIQFVTIAAAVLLLAAFALLSRGGEIRLTEADGTVRIFDERPATQPSATQPTQRPSTPVETAASYTVRIAPGQIAARWASANKNGARVLLQTGVHKISRSLNLTASDVTIDAEPGTVLYDDDPPTANQQCRYGIAVAGTGSTIRDLIFFSPDEYDQRFTALYVSGKDASIERVTFDSVYIGLLSIEDAENVTLRASRGRSVAYFAYAKGRGITIEDCSSPGAMHAFVRANLVDGLIVRRCSIYGSAGITIQKAANVLCEDLELSDCGIRCGPLNNKDGVRGEGGPIGFLAARSTNITFRNIRFIGNFSSHEVRIGNRSDTVRVENVSGAYQWRLPGPTKIDYLKGSNYAAGSVISPKAIDVWRDGVRQ